MARIDLLKDSTQIARADVKGGFVDLRAAFELGKVLFQFRKYDLTKPKGQRFIANQSVDIYMNLDTFSYLFYACVSGGINKILANGGYVNYGGTSKKGPVTARVFKIEGGQDDKYFLKAQSGPGKLTSTGAIQPAWKEPAAEVVLRLTSEQLKTLALCGQRAINIRDMWLAMGILDEKCAELKKKQGFASDADANAGIYEDAEQIITPYYGEVIYPTLVPAAKTNKKAAPELF